MATKLYLHNATNFLGGTFPTNHQSSTTNSFLVPNSAVLLTMDTTIGTTLQTLNITGPASAAVQNMFIRYYCSLPLRGAQTVGGGNANFYCSDGESNTSANFWVNGLNIYVWRPTTGAKVGIVRETTNASMGGAEATSAGVQSTTLLTNFTTTAISAADGDVVICEVWSTFTQAMATSYTLTFYYDGSFDITGQAENTTVANSASCLVLNENLTFKGFDFGAAALTNAATVTANGNVVRGDGTIHLCGWLTGDMRDTDSPTGTYSVQSAITKDGEPYAFRVNPAAGQPGFCNMQAYTGYYGNPSPFPGTTFGRVYIMPAVLPASGSEEICSVLDISRLVKLAVRINNNGVLSVYDSNQVLLGTGTTVLATSQWYRVELMTTSGGPNAPWELRIEGNTELTGTAADLSALTGYFRIGRTTDYNNNAVDFYYADFRWCSIRWPGAGSQIMLIPAAAGSNQTWTRGGTDTGANWSQVSGFPVSTSTWLVGSASGAVETEKCSIPPAGKVTKVNAVLLRTTHPVASGNQAQPRMMSGGTMWSGSNYGTSVRSELGIMFDTDPQTGQLWTPAALNYPLEVGAQDNGPSSRLIMYGCWAAVDFKSALQGQAAPAGNATFTPTARMTISSNNAPLSSSCTLTADGGPIPKGPVNFCGWLTGGSEEMYSQSGAPNVQSAVTRAGEPFALHVNNTWNGAAVYGAHDPTGLKAIANINTSYIRVYILAAAVPASGGTEEVLALYDTNSVQKCAVRIDSSSRLSLYIGSTKVLWNTGTTVLNSGTWYCIELACGSGSSAYLELRINGATELTGSANLGSNTNTGLVYIGRASTFTTTADIYYSSFYWHSATWVGPGTQKLLQVKAAGTYQTWTRGGTDSGANWSQVDEMPPANQDYLLSTLVDGQAETETVTTLAAGNIVSVNVVKPMAWLVQDTAAGAVRLRLRSGTTDKDTTTYTTASASGMLASILDKDPNTGAGWLKTSLTNLQVGAVEKSTTNKSRMNGAWVTVDYVPVIVTATLSSRATLTGVGRDINGGTSTPRGVSTVIATGSLTRRGSAQLGSLATVILANGRRILGGTAALTASTTVVPFTKRYQNAAANLTAVATVSPNATNISQLGDTRGFNSWYEGQPLTVSPYNADTTYWYDGQPLLTAMTLGTTGAAPGDSIAYGVATAAYTRIGQAVLGAVSTLSITVGQTRLGVAALTAKATVTSQAVMNRSATALLAGSFTVTPKGSVTHTGVASLKATATVTAKAAVTHTGFASLAAISTLTAKSAVTHMSAAGMTARASLVAAATIARNGVGGLTARATLAATGSVARNGAAFLAGIRTLIASAAVVHTGRAALAAISTVNAKGLATHTGVASLASTATVLTTGKVTHNGRASLSGYATLSLAQGAVTHTGIAALKGNTTLSAKSAVTHNGIANLSAITTFTAKGATTHIGRGVLTAQSTLLSAGSMTRGGRAALWDYTVLSVATGNVIHTGVAGLSGKTTMTARSAGSVGGFASLVANSNFMQTGKVTHAGAAGIAGVSTFTSTAKVTHNAAALMTGRTTLTAPASAARPGKATLSAQTILTTKGVTAHNAVATLNVVATVAAKGTPTRNGVAALTSSTVLLATGAVTHNAVATIAGLSTVTPRGAVTHVAVANLTGITTLAAKIVGTLAGRATLSAVSTLTSQAAVLHYGFSSVFAKSTLAATAYVAHNAAASLSAISTLAAKSAVARNAAATLSTVATFTPRSAAVRSAVAALTGVSTFGATARVLHTTIVTLSANSSLVATPAVVRNGVAALSGTASITAQGFVAHSARASISAQTSLVPLAAVLHMAPVILKAVVTVTPIAAATAANAGVAGLVARTTFSSAANVLYAGKASFAATANITGTSAVSHTGVGSLRVVTTTAANGVVVHATAQVLAATAAQTATASVSHIGVAILTAHVTLVPAAIVGHNAEANLYDTTTVTGQSGVTHGGVAQLGALVKITAPGTVNHTGIASLTAAATLTAQSAATNAGSAMLTSRTTVTPTPAVMRAGVATLQATATVLAASVSTAPNVGDAGLVAISTLSASSVVTYQGRVPLVATATITAAAGVSRVGEASLRAVAALTASSIVNRAAATTLAAKTTVTPTAAVVHVASGSLVSITTLSADARATAASGGEAILQAISTVTAQSAVRYISGASLAAKDMMVAPASVARNAVAGMAAISTLTPRSSVAQVAGASLVATATLAANGFAAHDGVANFRSQATMLATAAASAPNVGVAAIQAVSTVTGYSAVKYISGARLSATATLAAPASVARNAVAILAARSAVSSQSVVTHTAGAALPVTSTLNAGAVVAHQDAAILQAKVTTLATATATAPNAGVAAIQVISTVNAKSVVKYISGATLTGVVSLAASASVAHNAAAGLAAASTLTPQSTVTNTAGAVLSARTAFAVKALVGHYAAATLATRVSVLADATATAPNAGVANIQAVSKVTSTGVVAYKGAASFVATATFVATEAVARTGVVSIAAITTVVAPSSVFRTATARLNAVSAMTTKGFVAHLASAPLTAITTITANATAAPASTGEAPLAAITTVTSTAVVAHVSVSNLTAISTAVLAAGVTHTGILSVAGKATLTADAVANPASVGAAILTARTVFTAQASVLRYAQSVLASQTTLTVQAKLAHNAAASLAGQVTLTATALASPAVVGNAVLKATSMVLANSLVAHPAKAGLAARTTVVPQASAKYVTGANLAATSQLMADAPGKRLGSALLAAQSTLLATVTIKFAVKIQATTTVAAQAIVGHMTAANLQAITTMTAEPVGVPKGEAALWVRNSVHFTAQIIRGATGRIRARTRLMSTFAKVLHVAEANLLIPDTAVVPMIYPPGMHGVYVEANASVNYSASAVAIGGETTLGASSGVELAGAARLKASATIIAQGRTGDWFDVQSTVAATGNVSYVAAAHLASTSDVTAEGQDVFVEWDVYPVAIPSGEAFGKPRVIPNYVGSGVIQTGGSASIKGTWIFDLDCRYNQVAGFDVSITFLYNIGHLPYYWFRVEGVCLTPVGSGQGGACGNNTPLDLSGMVPPDSGKCPQKVIQMVAATSPDDVCRQLAQTGFVWQITRMSQFSVPAAPNAVRQQTRAGTIDPRCNKMTDVPFCQAGNCKQFCLQSDVVTNMGMHMTVIDTFYSYTGQGNLYLSGSATARRPSATVATASVRSKGGGGFGLGGKAEAISSHYKAGQEAGPIGVLIGGHAGVQSSYSQYKGDGGPTLGGQVGVVSSHSQAKGGGSLYLTGDASSRLARRYVSNPFGPHPPNFTTFKLGGEAKAVAGPLPEGWEPPVVAAAVSSTISPTGIPSAELFGTVKAAGKIYTNSIQSQGAFGNTSIHLRGLSSSAWGGKGYCVSMEPVYNGTPAPPIPPITTFVPNHCGCFSLPYRLQVSHDLNRAAPLFNFLTRNGLTMPNPVTLTYSNVSKSYQSNTHLSGLGDDGISVDRWMILFDWSCSSVVGGIDYGASLWRFSMLVTRRNTTTGRFSETRFLAAFPPAPICDVANRPGQGLNFGFKVDMQTLTFVTKDNLPVNTSLLYDNLELFSGPDWFKNPYFKVNISGLENPRTTPRQDISPIFPPALTVA